MDSVGQSRMAALHGGRRDKLEVSPNLWAGVGLVRGGAGTALVGDPETVAARMKEYMALGIDTFILSGYPHLEEAYRFAELVFPLLPLAHGKSARRVDANMGPFGETIANDHRARRSGGSASHERRRRARRRPGDAALALGAAGRAARRLGDRLARRAADGRGCCRRRAPSRSPSGRASATARCSPHTAISDRAGAERAR